MNSKKGYEYRIRLSENMIQQGYKEFDEISFTTFKKAYIFVCEKWGSEVLKIHLGLKIQERKIGTKEWSDCR
jgi:hypothetical protein